MPSKYGGSRNVCGPDCCANGERGCDDVSSNANILIIAMKRSWINECKGKFVPNFRARKIINLKVKQSTSHMRCIHFAHHELMKHLHFQFPFWHRVTERVELFRSRSETHAIQNSNKFRLLLLPNNLLLLLCFRWLLARRCRRICLLPSWKNAHNRRIAETLVTSRTTLQRLFMWSK